ncbi:MAG TPA: CoA transferase [Frankiaceae bacterium]
MTAPPYAGLLVVDFSRVLAGPFAGMMLADLGARVIKVERPATGDDSRSYGPFVDGRSLYFARVNRGKESVAVDLKDPAGRDLARRIARRADVVLENFRPGVMDRLGLGAETLQRDNPGLIVASISGFGQTGPLRETPAYDAVVQGHSGLLSITGAADGPPVKPGIPVADLAAGLYAFGAIGAALHARAATGRGARVDIAMFDATVSLLEGAALSYLATGRAPERIGNAHFSIAPFDTFACADGDITICAANDTLFGALAAALRLPELLADRRYADNAGRHDHRDALKAQLEAALAAGTRDHWLRQLGAAGVPCGPIADVAEAVSSPQAAARRMVVTAGGLPVPGQAVKADTWPDPVERPAAPALDEHGAAIRAEFA